MNALPAAHVLADFEAEASLARPQATTTKLDKASDGAAAKLEEAYNRGMLAGRAAAQGQFNAKLEEARAAAAARLITERAKWATETGADLARRLQEGLRELEAQLADATARILKPFLQAELQRQAVAELQA